MLCSIVFVVLKCKSNRVFNIPSESISFCVFFFVFLYSIFLFFDHFSHSAYPFGFYAFIFEYSNVLVSKFMLLGQMQSVFAVRVNYKTTTKKLYVCRVHVGAKWDRILGAHFILCQTIEKIWKFVVLTYGIDFSSVSHILSWRYYNTKIRFHRKPHKMTITIHVSRIIIIVWLFIMFDMGNGDTNEFRSNSRQIIGANEPKPVVGHT